MSFKSLLTGLCLSVFLTFSLGLSPKFNMIAQAAPPPPEAFGALPAIYDAAISPNGQKIAAIVNSNGNYYVRIVKLNDPNSQKNQVKLNKGVKPLWVKWANNEQVLTAFWQSEDWQGTRLTMGFIHTVNVNTFKGKKLVKPPLGMLRQYNHRVIDWLENDPDHILMSYSDISQLKSPDLHKVNVVTGRSKVMHRSIKNTQNWITDHNGEPRVAYGQKDDANGTKVMKIRLSQSDEWRDVSEFSGLEADTRVFGFTSNLNELVIGDYRGRDTLGLYVYDLNRKSIGRKIYHNDQYDVSGIVLSANGDDIVGARYIADTEETVLLNDRDSLLTRMRQLYEGFQIDYIDQSQSGDALLVKVSHAYDPGQLMLIRDGQDPTSLGYYYPSLKSDDLGTVISVRYTARDGQKIPAYVTIPPAITSTEQLKKIPFIVLPHGGPYARDDKRFDYFAQYFATRGYGVLQMNFRGSEGFGKSFEEAGRKNWVVMQEDVEDGARFLLEKGYADPNRLCIAGWSFGGYAALLGAAKNDDLYKCAISMAGLTDISSFISTQRQYQFGRSSARNFILNGFESRDDIRENSPIQIASDIKIPLFLAHGEADQRVSFEQFEKMRTALRKSKADVTYMVFDDEDHFLSNQSNRIKFFKGLDRFLVKANGRSEYAR